MIEAYYRHVILYWQYGLDESPWGGAISAGIGDSFINESLKLLG